MPTPLLDPAHAAGSYFLFDGFIVPDAARAEFEEKMTRNMNFISTLPGFRGHLVLERRDGNASFNLVTLAAWENQDALEAAKADVGAYYRRIGFDPKAELRRWGATLVRGGYEVRR